MLNITTLALYTTGFLRGGSTKIVGDSETARVCKLAKHCNEQRIILGGKVRIERNFVFFLGTFALSGRCSFKVYLLHRCSTSEAGVNAKQG